MGDTYGFHQEMVVTPIFMMKPEKTPTPKPTHAALGNYRCYTRA